MSVIPVQSIREEAVEAFANRLRRLVGTVSESLRLAKDDPIATDCRRAIDDWSAATPPGRVGFACHVVPAIRSVGAKV